ncbi:MAG TPA: CoA pyrophosphatase [Pyrinomonadaceae bacterium]|nr:CoA pyrophosphatase [Pyrinomonadaceae bacterium]
MSRREADEFDLIRERLGARLAPTADEDAAAAAEPRRAEAGWRQAAVALILRRNAGAADLLVIKRADDPRDHWSGHLALPGGRREPSDADLSFTAVRETLEEVGMDLSAGGRVLGRLDTITPRSPLVPPISVTPYVALAPPAYHVAAEGGTPSALTLSDEVDAAFWVPVSFLRRNGASEVFRLVVEEEEREWPAYATDYGLIWGLTERILTTFLKLIQTD